MPQPAPLSDTLITDTASKGGRGKADDADLGSRSRLSVTSMLRSRAAWPMRWTRPSSPTPSGQRPHSPPLTSTRKWSGEGSGRRSWSRRWIGSGCSRIDDHPGLRASDALISACSWRPGQADQGGRADVVVVDHPAQALAAVATGGATPDCTIRPWRPCGGSRRQPSRVGAKRWP